MRVEKILGLVALVGILAGATARAGQQGMTNMIVGTNGAELFVNYCASCHGRDGKGGGPTAVALKFQTPDLTMIAKRNNAVFPRERLKAAIAGPEDLFIPAHGTNLMPVWGPMFRALDPSGDAQKRIDQILTYVESLQVK